MKLLFVDFSPLDYDVETPMIEPLGGSQSALCYLAVSLKKRGHDIYILNQSLKSKKTLDIDIVSLKENYLELLNNVFDACIVLNGPADSWKNLRPYLKKNTPLILWTQHADDQPPMANLISHNIASQWDIIACISLWQRDAYFNRFGIPKSKMPIFRNAISPCFENLFLSKEDFFDSKNKAIAELAYTSTPFRGLDILLALYPSIHSEFKDTLLYIYSGMKVYQLENTGKNQELVDIAKNMDGVCYKDSLPQARLAQELKNISILSYPNTFPETSCIAVMEAMAAGAFILTTELGALPETTAGFAELISLDNIRDRSEYAKTYMDKLRLLLKRRKDDRLSFIEERWEQVLFMNSRMTWNERAIEWEDTLMNIKYHFKT